MEGVGERGWGQGLEAVVASASLVKGCRFVVQGAAATSRSIYSLGVACPINYSCY